MSTTTNTALLIGLRDPANDKTWTEFCDRYNPVLLAFARRLGLDEHDAQDATQETLLAFTTAYRQGRYQREKGRLRTWLYAIASNKIRDIQRKRARERVVNDDSDRTNLFERIPDEHSMSELWEAEWCRAILKVSLREVRQQLAPTSMRVFELCVLCKWPIDQAAAHLGMTREAVLKAKTRVLTRLRETCQRLEMDW